MASILKSVKYIHLSPGLHDNLINFSKNTYIIIWPLATFVLPDLIGKDKTLQCCSASHLLEVQEDYKMSYRFQPQITLLTS